MHPNPFRRLARAARFTLAALAALGATASPAVAGGWPSYAGGPSRRFFNGAPSPITPENVSRLRVKWKFQTGAIVTASPSVATVPAPGGGAIQLAFIQSWDHHLYALRTSDGAPQWAAALDDQPGAPFPNTASAEIRSIGGKKRVFIAAGESVYALDAATGEQIWRFDAGTGCVAPGACAFGGEQNEVESSPIVADGKVLFGMDVNEGAGKGGFFAVDARDGRLAWYFDVETGATCTPRPGDVVRRFDGYHSEGELGLPSGFFSTRAGCDFARERDGGGGVWSSAAVDGNRKLLFFATAASGEIPNSRPFEEAIVALHLDGTVAWRWRPRAIDLEDLDFGAVPNLFTMRLRGKPRAVVGVGGKDGTYYVLDREGENRISGVRWDDPDPSALPYWRRQVVPGGANGGIIATAAVDQRRRRVFFSTAPGTDDDLFTPQRPTVHALDLDTGAILWEDGAGPGGDASFAPTSAIPGLVFVGKSLGGSLRVYDAENGALLTSVPISFTLASAPAVVDGLVILGGGAGARSGDPNDDANVAAGIPTPVTALCVAGTRGCD